MAVDERSHELFQKNKCEQSSDQPVDLRFPKVVKGKRHVALPVGRSHDPAEAVKFATLSHAAIKM